MSRDNGAVGNFVSELIQKLRPMVLVMRKRAPRNRTLACTDEEIARLNSRHTTTTNCKSRRWPPDSNKSPSGKPRAVQTAARTAMQEPGSGGQLPVRRYPAPGRRWWRAAGYRSGAGLPPDTSASASGGAVGWLRWTASASERTDPLATGRGHSAASQPPGAPIRQTGLSLRGAVDTRGTDPVP